MAVPIELASAISRIDAHGLESCRALTSIGSPLRIRQYTSMPDCRSSASPKYSDPLVMIEIDRILLLLFSMCRRLFHLAGHACFAVPNFRPAPAGEPRLTQPLAVLRRSAPKRLQLTPADRIFWVYGA